ncbi:hypothetical protein BDW59DRAFT_140562 [Aspergillus cavernicola]|uniref:Pre-mRNA-splicing factor 38B n=1 Tax=Aspergillus cavernicola TaxID=176166 RepID=A0ABR4IWE3_9EURO
MPRGLENAIGDPHNDDYVAQVLANEARDSSLKYSAVGTEAYIPRRPTSAAPKPNTRFLRHIIKETDNHNTALKRKEEREARERMRQLRNQAPSSSHNSARDHHRHSHRSDERDSQRERRGDRDYRHRSHRTRRRSRSASSDRDRPRASRQSHASRDHDDDRYKRPRRSHRHRSYSRSRSRSPHDRDLKSRGRHRRDRKRSSPHTRSPQTRERRKDIESPRREQYPNYNQAVETESDPLEDFVGPLTKENAPIRSRGRGAYKPNTSNIDSHFAPGYDPTLDVQPDDDDVQTSNKSTRRPVAGLMMGDDDWELALEALRDRARWKQKDEERLREAGFNNDIVERWKSNASTATGDEEGRLDDVKWSTPGQGREWDRGKVVDEDGHISIKASW